MKKKCEYVVKLILSTETAEILYAECQCAAGTAPNGAFKHKATLLIC